MLQQTWRKTILRDTKLPFFEQNKLMQQTRGKHSMFWWCASTKQGKRAVQNARVCAIWIIYALESATRFDRVGVLSSQAAQRRETERFVRSLADDEGFCLCVTLSKDHCVQVPWQYINVCGYSDQFCKIPHTYYILYTTYILRTYYVQNEWSHSLLLNSVQARQKQ